MRALREFEPAEDDIKELICEDVLDQLSEEQISVKLNRIERLGECLFDNVRDIPSVPEAFAVFKDMLVARDFRISDSLMGTLGKLFEESITRFRHYSPGDKQIVKTMIVELRRL